MKFNYSDSSWPTSMKLATQLRQTIKYSQLGGITQYFVKSLSGRLDVSVSLTLLMCAKSKCTEENQAAMDQRESEIS